MQHQQATTQEDGEERATQTTHLLDVIAWPAEVRRDEHCHRRTGKLHYETLLGLREELGAAVSHSATEQGLRQLESDPIMVDSQETGKCEEDEPRRVLHQILRHLLQQADPVHVTNGIIFVGEEYLDLMQDILPKRASSH